MRREGWSVGPNCSAAATKLRGPTDHPHRTLTISPRARNRMMVWRLVFNSRATAATGCPSARRASANASCLSLNALPAQHFAGLTRTSEPGGGALQQQITFELCDRNQHHHRHLAGCACEVRPAQREAMDADAHRRQLLDRRPDIHRITAKPVEFGDDQHVAFFQPIEQLRESGPLFRCNRAGHALGNDAAWVNVEAGCTDFDDLIVCCLLGCRDPAVGKDSAQLRAPPSNKDGRTLTPWCRASSLSSRCHTPMVN